MVINIYIYIYVCIEREWEREREREREKLNPHKDIYFFYNTNVNNIINN